MQDGRKKKMESSFEYEYYTSTAPALYIHILSQVGNPCNKKKHHKNKKNYNAMLFLKSDPVPYSQ